MEVGISFRGKTAPVVLAAERRSRRFAGVLLVLASVCVLAVGAVLNVRYGFTPLGRVAAPDPGPHPDFEIFWGSARTLLGGGNMYDADGGFANLNPPLFILTSVPLGLTDGITAYQALVLAMIAIMIGALALVTDETRLRVG